MRITVSPALAEDVDAFEIRRSGKRIRVFLDGVEQSLVITADEETGELVRCVPDANGKPQVDPADRESVWIETLRGRVEVRIEDDQ